MIIKGQKELKRAIFQKAEEITDEELFLSSDYETFLTQMQEGLLDIQKQVGNVRMVVDANGGIAFTTATDTCINYSSSMAMGLSRLEKHKLFTGLNLHESGHKLFSDFCLSRNIDKNICDGIIYPMLSSTTPFLDEVEAFMAKGDEERRLIAQMFGKIDNCIEDGFVDRAIKTVAPGYAPYLNFVLGVDHSIGTKSYSERLLNKEKDEDIFVSMILHYARFGDRLYEESDKGELIDAIKECESLIMNAVYQPIPILRAKKVWEVFCFFFHFVKIQNDKNQRNQQSQSQQKQSKGQKKSSNQEKNSSGQQNQSGQNAGNSDSNQTDSGNSGHNSLKDMLNQMNQKMQSSEHTKRSGNETGANQEATEQLKQMMEKPDNSQNPSSSSGKKDTSSSCSELEQLVNKVAQAAVAAQQEKEIAAELNENLAPISKGIHRNVESQVNRISVTPEGEMLYQQKHTELDAIEKRLCREFKKEIEERQTGDTTTGLYMGKRITTREIFRKDKKIFNAKKLPEDIPDMAVGILIDLSGSMSGNRVEKAKECAYITYKFCKEMGIQTFVFGHNDTFKVQLYSAVDEFSFDGNDEKRIFSLAVNGSNRDGFALRYCLNKLRSIDAEQKLMLIISDGRPASSGYGLEEGRKDCQDAVTCAMKDGIYTIAAGIGDAASVKSVYKEGLSDKNSATYMDMSDLQKLPKAFVKVIKAYLE